MLGTVLFPTFKYTNLVVTFILFILKYWYQNCPEDITSKKAQNIQTKTQH